MAYSNSSKLDLNEDLINQKTYIIHLVVYFLVSLDGGMPAEGRQHHLQSIHNDTHVLLILSQQGEMVPRHIHNLQVIAVGRPAQPMC